MEDTSRTRPAAEEIERYRREMMTLYGKTAAPAQTIPTAPSSPPQPETPAPQPEQSPPVLEETPFIGYLRAFVFTANGAEPLQGARVIVSRREEGSAVLYANTETNMDGFTPVIPLPTVDPALSLQPGNPLPFIPYDIEATAEGFRPARHENVPIYGNNYVTQPISLVPLLPDGTNSSTETFESGGPADL